MIDDREGATIVLFMELTSHVEPRASKLGANQTSHEARVETTQPNPNQHRAKKALNPRVPRASSGNPSVPVHAVDANRRF
jgi:hypothetical protein